MAFIQSITGAELIPMFNSSYVGSPLESFRSIHSLKDVYDTIKQNYALSGDHLLIAKLDYAAPYWIYRVNMIPIQQDIHLFDVSYVKANFNASIDTVYYKHCIYITIVVYDMPNRNYDGSNTSLNNYSRETIGGLSVWRYNPTESPTTNNDYPSYAYTPNWDSANGTYKVYFNEKIPIRYNYKPVDYIYGNATSLKLSMIKEEFTNSGNSVEFTAPTNVQRLTDKTNLHSILTSTPLNSTKILGYTDSNNYVALRKTLESDSIRTGVIQYYIDSVHQANLDFEISMLYGNPDTEFKYYLSYLIDTVNKAVRQSIIMIRSSNNSGFYNKEENDRNVVTEGYQTLMFQWLSTGWFTESSDDPNEQGGTSNPGGGSGDYNNIGDDIPFPTEPLVSTVDADFVTVYNPTVEQIKSLAKYMWGDGFNLESLKKIFADPMDCIIGLHIIPCPIPNNGIKQVKVGNILSPITMNLASEQFVDVDCGSIKINEYWGSYLDYSPYTKIIIYLPYIGTKSLEVDDVMSKTVHVKYRIDIITGSCVCFILVNDIVMYQFTGFCLATIPITSQDYKTTLSSIMSMGIARAGVAASIASGGVLAPVAGIAAAHASANAVMNKKPAIEHSGSASGTAGFMSIQTPYIIITRARQCLPKGQNTFSGYPSYTTKKLSDLTGFTQLEEIHLNSLSCTEGELTEIETLLKGGVII